MGAGRALVAAAGLLLARLFLAGAPLYVAASASAMLASAVDVAVVAGLAVAVPASVTVVVASVGGGGPATAGGLAAGVPVFAASEASGVAGRLRGTLNAESCWGTCCG